MLPRPSQVAGEEGFVPGYTIVCKSKIPLRNLGEIPQNKDPIEQHDDTKNLRDGDMNADTSSR